MTPPAVEWDEVVVSGTNWRLTWDDDELCDHILVFQPDASSPNDGYWERVGACTGQALWSESALPWLVVEILMDRRQAREARS